MLMCAYFSDLLASSVASSVYTEFQKVAKMIIHWCKS